MGLDYPADQLINLHQASQLISNNLEKTNMFFFGLEISRDKSPEYSSCEGETINKPDLTLLQNSAVTVLARNNSCCSSIKLNKLLLLEGRC